MSQRIVGELMSGLCVSLWCAGAIGADAAKPRLRVGVYDNRAIAVAYAPSQFNPVSQKMQQLREAQSAGDTDRVKQLQEWGRKSQRQLHRQGFGRVPVDDLLAHVKDRLPDVARQAGVDLITWQCDYTDPDVEVVDVTNELVKLFEPSDKTLRIVAELKKQPPLDLDTIEQHQDD